MESFLIYNLLKSKLFYKKKKKTQKKTGPTNNYEIVHFLN